MEDSNGKSLTKDIPSKPSIGKSKHPEIAIGSWNVQRGLFCRKVEICELANNLDILVLSETDAADLVHYHIPGCKSFLPLTDPNLKTRVVILVKEWLVPHVQLREDLMERNFSTVWISIAKEITGVSFNLCAVYREWNHCGDTSQTAQVE